MDFPLTWLKVQFKLIRLTILNELANSIPQLEKRRIPPLPRTQNSTLKIGFAYCCPKTVTSTGATPELIMSMVRAAAAERSMTLPPA